MNQQQWNDGLNHIDPDLLNGYLAKKEQHLQIQNTKRHWLQFAAIAACICLIIGSFILMLMFHDAGVYVKYQRIKLTTDTLGDSISSYITPDTSVINAAKENLPPKLPIYKITERTIDEQEFQTMLEQLADEYDPFHPTIPDGDLKGNTIVCNWASFADFSRGYFDMSDEELESLSWKIFEQIPFLQGEYEYLGIRRKNTLEDSEGEHVARVGVSFRRLLDEMRIVGEEECILYFDGTGLVGLKITLFDYKKIGTMDLVDLESAYSRITTPDAFSMDKEINEQIKIIQVDRVRLQWVNHYDLGCKILQPIYNFSVTATDVKGTQTEFASLIIAIPESYTYEAD